MKRCLGAFLACLALGACGACRPSGEPPGDAANLPRIDVDFSIEERERCQHHGRSPEITLTDLPNGVAGYDVKMTDLDAPRFKHWNQTITSGGSAIRAGAGLGYVGPACPANGHRYRISVLARNGQKEPIGYGEKTVIAERAP